MVRDHRWHDVAARLQLDRRRVPPDPPWPNFEQRIAVTQVFYLLKATPTPPPGVYPPNAPALQVNVVITNLMPDEPVTYQIYVTETDN